LMTPDKIKPTRLASDSKPQRERREPRRDKPRSRPDKDKERFRIEVGHEHGVQPGNIVGAIANEAGLDGQHIGHIEINAEFSLVDLPVGMPREVFKDLKKVWVCGQQLKISRLNRPESEKSPASKPASKKASAPKPRAKKKGSSKSKERKTKKLK